MSMHEREISSISFNVLFFSLSSSFVSMNVTKRERAVDGTLKFYDVSEISNIFLMLDTMTW